MKQDTLELPAGTKQKDSVLSPSAKHETQHPKSAVIVHSRASARRLIGQLVRVTPRRCQLIVRRSRYEGSWRRDSGRRRCTNRGERLTELRAMRCLSRSNGETV
ncbi:hypothetical protein AOLI_G00293990 [Acnodon oligacanthus]